MKRVVIYTDGSCSGNPGVGGWGAVLIYGEAKKQISEELKKGNMIILYIPGHYIALAPGKDGKVILMDPGKRANNGTYTIDAVYNLTKNYKNRCTSSNNCGWHGVYSFSKK